MCPKTYNTFVVQKNTKWGFHSSFEMASCIDLEELGDFTGGKTVTELKLGGIWHIRKYQLSQGKKSFVKSWQENKNFTLHSLFLCCLLSSCPCVQWTNCRTIILLSRSLYISSLLIVSHLRFLSSWLNNKTDRHFCFHENFTSAESTYSSLHLDGSSLTVQRNLSLLQYLAPEPWVGGSRMRLEEKGSWHRPAGSSSRCLWCHLHCIGLAFPWHSDRLPSRASFTTTVQEPPTNKYSQDPPERSGTRVTGCPGTAI